MALDFFRAEAGKTYKSTVSGATAYFTQDQLKDPNAGMIPTDYVLQQSGAAQSPSAQQDVAGVRSVPLPQYNAMSSSDRSSFASGSNQTSPSASTKDVNVITSNDANQKVADSAQASNTGLTKLEQDQSRLEMQYAQKAAKQQKLMNEEAALKQVLGSVNATELANKNLEEQRTQKAAEFRLGQTGTYYQENAADKAKQAYEGQVYRLNLQDQILQNQITQAYDNNNVNLANELQAKKDKLVENAQKQQQDAFDNMIKMSTLDSKLSGDADKAFEQIAEGGTDINDEQMSYLEHKYHLPPGMGSIKLKANQQEVERKSIKDEKEARKADLDIANTITTLLAKVPAGQPVTIGGHEYVGLDKGDVSTGVQTNSLTGESTLWSYNKLTGDVKTTSLGTIGTAKDGWETKFDDSGNPWRFNATTGQMLPFSATPAQQDFQQIIPEGSVSPFKNADGKPRVECGEWTNDCNGIGVGNSYESKMAKMDIWKKDDGGKPEDVLGKLRIGDAFTQHLNTWTGHVGMILGIQKGPDGVVGIIASESNYPIPGKISSSRFVPLSQIDGFGKAKKLSPIFMSGPDTSRFSAEPTAVAGTPAPIGPQQVNIARTGVPTFGAKKTKETEPMSITDLEKVNAGLPEDKKLQPGATLEDAKNAGFTPGSSSGKPLKLDDKQRQLIAKSDEKKSIDAGRGLVDALDRYKSLVEKYGFESFGAGKTALEGAYADLKIKYKDMAGLGALTGPDVALLEQAIKPATGTEGFLGKFTSGGNAGILSGIEDAKKAAQRGMLRSFDNLGNQYQDYANDSYLKSLGKGLSIRVKDKSTGKTGTLPADEFDPSKFERL